MSEILYDKDAAENPIRQLTFKIRGELFEKFNTPQLIEQMGQLDGNFAEIGCGYGDKMEGIQDALSPNSSLIGVDNSSHMLQKAKQKKPDTAFLQDDALTLESLDDGSFDGLFYLDIIHHFSLEEIRQSLTVAERKLKPGGKIFVMSFFSPEGVFKKRIFEVLEGLYAMASALGKREAYQHPTKEWLEQTASDLGLRKNCEIAGPFARLISKSFLVFEKEV